MNADIMLHCDATEDDLIDAIEGNRKYIPCIYVLNKIDQITMEELNVLDKIPHYVPIAGMLGWNFDELLETIWDYQDLIRVYTKPKVGFFDSGSSARLRCPSYPHQKEEHRPRLLYEDSQESGLRLQVRPGVGKVSQIFSSKGGYRPSATG